jgi:hypothetical protein
MKYLALIYGSQERRDSLSEEERSAVYERYNAFGDEAGDRIVTGAELQSPATATTVRVRGDETVVTDGPFAETKEQLGGYYVLECASLDEAVQLAARIPGAEHGIVEVRPAYVDAEAEQGEESAA